MAQGQARAANKCGGSQSCRPLSEHGLTPTPAHARGFCRPRLVLMRSSAPKPEQGPWQGAGLWPLCQGEASHEPGDGPDGRCEDHQEAQRFRPPCTKLLSRGGAEAQPNSFCAIAVVLAGSKLAIIKSEVDILKSVEHPYIVKCFDAVDSPDKMYLVMEMCAAACAHSVQQAWARPCVCVGVAA